MNTIIDELVQMGLLPEDGEVLKACAFKYQCCNLYDLISVRIPTSQKQKHGRSIILKVYHGYAKFF